MSAHPAGDSHEHHLLTAARTMPDPTFYAYACGTLATALRAVLGAMETRVADLGTNEQRDYLMAQRALDAYDAGRAQRQSREG